MNGLMICEDLFEAIANREIKQGRLHSAFEHSCNIETERGLATLITGGRTMAPMSIQVENCTETNFKRFAFNKPALFEFSPEGILCRDGDMYVSLANAVLWSPGMADGPAGSSESDIEGNLRAMAMRLETSGKSAGMGRFTGILRRELPNFGFESWDSAAPEKGYEFIENNFICFIRTLAAAKKGNIADAAAGIIGFGPGLTPSMDDFLAGVMVSAAYMARNFGLDLRQVLDFNRTMVGRSLSRTTRVSAEMLRHAAEGRTSEAARELVQAILGKGGEASITGALDKTIEIGETSGSDLALGIYTGCRILNNSEYKRIFIMR